MIMALKAGFAVKSILPNKPNLLRGQFNVRRATKALDPLLCTALYVSDGVDHTVLISLDMTGISSSAVSDIAREVAKELPGFDESRLAAACTHTHTAPFLESDNAVESWGEAFRLTDEVLEGSQRPEEYKSEVFVPACARAIIEAARSAEECTLSAFCEYAPIGHIRRARYLDGSSVMYGETENDAFDQLEGGADNAVTALFFHTEDGRPKGAIVNVSCPAQVWEHGDKYSADYIGRFRELASDMDMPILTLIGAAGNVAPRDLLRHRQRFMTEPKDGFAYMYGRDGVNWAGERLCEAFRRAYGSRIPVSDGFYHSFKMLDLPLFTVTEEEYEEALAGLKAFYDKYGSDIYSAPDMERMQSASHAGKVKRYERQKKSPYYSSAVHVIALGDVAIATNPFELYNQYGQRMIARSPFAFTMVSQLTSDSGGYLPTDDAIRAKSYSATVSDCMVRQKGGDMLTEYTVNELKKAFETLKST